MNEMDGKTTFGQLFQTRCFVEERIFLREETKWLPSPCPREKGT